MGGKTRNIAVQFVLQQCCKTSCMLFATRFSVPLATTTVTQISLLNYWECFYKKEEDRNPGSNPDLAPRPFVSQSLSLTTAPPHRPTKILKIFKYINLQTVSLNFLNNRWPKPCQKSIISLITSITTKGLVTIENCNWPISKVEWVTATAWAEQQWTYARNRTGEERRRQTLCDRCQ